MGMARECNSQAGRTSSNLRSEQFWGRAVRASCDSKEFGALLRFWPQFLAPVSKWLSRRVEIPNGCGTHDLRLARSPLSGRAFLRCGWRFRTRPNQIPEAPG